MEKINQVSDRLCDPVSRMGITDDQEDCSGDHIHSEWKLSCDSHGRDVHSPFITYDLSDQLKNDMGDSLRDMGSQVLLVKETSLARGLRNKRQVVKIHGITGNMIETKGNVGLYIGETSPHEFILKFDLPMKCDTMLGQECLERFWLSI
jgi:hypothetical protein